MPKYAATSQYSHVVIALWEDLKAHEGQQFDTVNDLRYRYYIRGSIQFMYRKDKSINRATVNLAYRRAMALEGNVCGTKALGIFGAGYLYLIFIELGFITSE